MQVLKSRQISAQETVYRLGGLKLYSTSRTFVTLNTLPYEKQYKVIKPIAERLHLSPNCSDEHTVLTKSHGTVKHWCMFGATVLVLSFEMPYL